MGAERDLLERIASALERLSPPPSAPTDWTAHPAYIWDGKSASGIDALDALPLEALRGIDEQKDRVHQNLSRFAQRAATHDMLLWGARGMGKSALIRAVVSDIQGKAPEALALVHLAPGSVESLPQLMQSLSQIRRGFILFLDDLGFENGQAQHNLALRSLLDGGVAPRPANVRVAVTANRRAIVTRDGIASDALHERDERDNALALADRFGITLGFHPCDRDTYLGIVRGYTEPLGLEIDEEEALAWAIARGNRSGRTAYQFSVEMAGRAGKVV